MLFEVNPHTGADIDVVEKPVTWIKEFRHHTNLGLRESKSVCDFVRACLQSHSHINEHGNVVLDTNLYTMFHFLEKCREVHRPNPLIAMVNFDIGQRTLNQREYRDSVNPNVPLKPKPKAPVPGDILKNTAIRLIRCGAITEARDVLKILM